MKSAGIIEFLQKIFAQSVAPVIFIGKVGTAVCLQLKQRKLRWNDVRYYFDLCGAQSLPIVLMICFLMGLILGFQAAVQMRKVGTDIFVADLVGFSVLKEFGPFMVAIIATGRAGSAFAAEIGTMQVDEEISALSTLGINPEKFLILPKLLAMLGAMPLLTIFGDFAGLLGGFIVGVTYLDLPAIVYIDRTFEVLTNTTFILGVLKSFAFAVLITLCGCYYGFQASADAQGVGRSATSAVVSSIFFVVFADSIITLLYSQIGY